MLEVQKKGGGKGALLFRFKLILAYKYPNELIISYLFCVYIYVIKFFPIITIYTLLFYYTYITTYTITLINIAIKAINTYPQGRT